MSAVGLSLREYLPAMTRSTPFAVDQVGAVHIAAVASAWGFWCGLDGEEPAVAAAMEVLRAETQRPHPDWFAALERAFDHTSEQLAAIPWPEDADDIRPSTSLTCVVSTPDGIWIGWAGGIEAARIVDGRVAEATTAHTYYAQLAREQPEALEHAKFPIKTMLTNYVDAKGFSSEPPTFTQWSPLCANQQLLLAPHTVVAFLREEQPPTTLSAEAWLHATLELRGEERNELGRRLDPDRIGVVVRPHLGDTA